MSKTKSTTTSQRIQEALSKTLANARRALKLTQEDAAERIGISAEFYARIERGSAIPSVQTMLIMSDSLGVTPDALLGYRPLSPPDPSLEPNDANDVRLAIRRLRGSRPELVRFINKLLQEWEQPQSEAAPASEPAQPDSEQASAPTSTDS